MRRIVAIVLPQLACEIARRKRASTETYTELLPEEGVSRAKAQRRVESRRGSASPGPLGVILEPDGAGLARLETAVLDAVEDEARRFGVRPGQRVTEAAALLTSLTICRVTYDELDAALGRVADVALGFGPTAALQICATAPDTPRTAWGDAPFDTVWLDVTGAAHLAGGEEALLAELEERVGALGHRVRLAIAGGPRLAQALARWSPGLSGAPDAPACGRHAVAPTRPEGSAGVIAPLPLAALPIDPSTVSFLLRSGVFTVGDLARLPRAAAAARLGSRAALVLDLAAGRDPAPLLAYAPPREIVEETSFEDGVENAEALLFVLRGMVSRASVRLLSRGEACTRVTVTLPIDRSIAALRAEGCVERMAIAEEGAVSFHVELPAPLAEEADLLRALRARLERTELFAPAVGVRLSLSQIVPAPKVQLDLSRDRAVAPDSLPALLAELSAEIGADRVGRLVVEDAHRPEAQSRLVAVTLGGENKGGGRREQLSFPGAWSRKAAPIPPPARLLPAPVLLGKVGKGGVVAIGDSPRGPGGDPQIFAIERLEFLARLDEVEWWTRTPSSRDYAKAWLVSGDEGNKRRTKAACAEALVYVTRRTGEVFLQGYYE